MLRSKDTQGECNGKYDENYFGSFTTRNFNKPRSPQLIYSDIQLLTLILAKNLTETSVSVLKKQDFIRQIAKDEAALDTG